MQERSPQYEHTKIDVQIGETFDFGSAADRDLIDAGVIAIIGHATSSQTLAGLTVDKYGDAVRPIHLGVIRDGKYTGL